MKPEVKLHSQSDASGADTYLLTFGKMQVEVATLGAAIRSIRVPDQAGEVDEITLGWEDASGWIQNGPYFGVSVGRYANRIAHARFRLDGKEYLLPANDGPNHLHGGPEGFSHKNWTAKTFQTELDAGVEFSLSSPDGEGGYPGNLDVVARVSLTDRCVIKTVYEVRTDKPTPVNLTNHAYFNLGGPHHSTVLDHLMWSSAKEWLPVGPGAIPTGVVSSVADTPFDFRVPKLLGRDIAKTEGGYDHCLVLDSQNKPLPSVREAARISLPSKGRTLRLYTDQSGFQLYSGNFLGGVTGRGGRLLKPHAGLCLESQRFPDSLERKDWVPPILRPGEIYRHEFHYAFEF